jgi:hypothetical protein
MFFRSIPDWVQSRDCEEDWFLQKSKEAAEMKGVKDKKAAL